MKEINSFALLEDLARLVRKHGPTAFSDLSALLQNPGKIEELVTILDAGATAGQRARIHQTGVSPSPRKSPSASLTHLISGIKTTDPERAELLSKFYEDLSAKRALPTLRELREFIRESHLRGADSASREKAIGQLIRDLSGRPSEQLNSILGRVRSVESRIDDRSLERWADVILDKTRSRG